MNTIIRVHPKYWTLSRYRPRRWGRVVLLAAGAALLALGFIAYASIPGV